MGKGWGSDASGCNKVVKSLKSEKSRMVIHAINGQPLTGVSPCLLVFLHLCDLSIHMCRSWAPFCKF